MRTFTEPMARVDRAVLDGDTDGFVKVHLRAGSDRIVGATVVARHAGEMISELRWSVAHSRSEWVSVSLPNKDVA